MTIINLRNGRSIVTDHIVSFQKIGDETRFHLSNGEVVTGDPWSDPAEAFVSVIPAAPGHYAIFAWLGTDGAMHYDKRSIIGWKLCAGGNYPTFIGWSEMDTDYEATIDPTGTVSDSDNNQWASFNEWRRHHEESILATKVAA